MTNSLYDFGREEFLNGNINWSSDDIRVILIDTGIYSVDLNNHKYLNDIDANSRVKVSSSLTSKSSNNGVADADDVIFSAFLGVTIEALVIYKHTGTENTSPLIAYIDSANNLPITPNGSEMILQWSNDSNKIFKL